MWKKCIFDSEIYRETFLFTNFKTENYEENSCNGFGRCGYFFRKLR